MKSFIKLLTLCAVFFSSSYIYAQSFWLHKPLFANDGLGTLSLISAVDTNNFIFSQHAFDPVHTNNYGLNWNGVFHQDPKLRYSIIGQAHLSKNLIILACNDQYNQLYHKEGKPEYDIGHIIRSSDGGITWTDFPLGVRDTSITEFQARLRLTSPIGAIKALDSNHIFVGTMTTHYLHSSDGGITWDSIPTPVAEHRGGHFMMGNSIVNPVAAYPAPNTLIVAEYDSAYPYANYVHKIYRSTDLGKSWNAGFQMMTSITDIEFTNPMIGFATGYVYDYDSPDPSVTIDKTTDGGETWSNVYSKQFAWSPRLTGIAFADSLYALAVGDGGLILRTIDGGETWNRMMTDIPTGDSGLVLCDVAYPTRTKAMIAASTGEVFIYQTDPLLDMPNITFPKYGEVVPKDVTISWEPVAGATRYHLILVLSNLKKTIIDTLVEDNYFMFHDSVTRQYDFYVTALNETKTSNPNHRIVRFWIPAAVSWGPGANQYLNLIFSPSRAAQAMHCTVYGLYSVRDRTTMDLRLYDIFGRECLNLSDEIWGKQEPYVSFNIPFSSLNSGVYLAVLLTSNGSATGKMIIVR